MIAQALAAALAKDCSVTDLNLSWNRIRERGCLCIADALAANTKLRMLCMDGNPVGKTGGQALLEAFTSGQAFSPGAGAGAADGADADASPTARVPRSGASDGPMRVVSLDNCNFESYQSDDGPTPFNVREPNGHYNLDLQNPYDRMVAKQLQTLAYTQGGECWRGEKIDGVTVDFPEVRVRSLFTRMDYCSTSMVACARATTLCTAPRSRRACVFLLLF